MVARTDFTARRVESGEVVNERDNGERLRACIINDTRTRTGTLVCEMKMYLSRVVGDAGAAARRKGVRVKIINNATEQPSCEFDFVKNFLRRIQSGWAFFARASQFFAIFSH